MNGEQDLGLKSFFGELEGDKAWSPDWAGPVAVLNADDRGDIGVNGKMSLTSDEAAAQLGRGNLSWGGGLGQPAVVTFAFRSTGPTTNPEDTEGFTRFNPAQISSSLGAFNAWSDVANIRFQRVDDGDGYSNSATMLLGNYVSGADGSAAFAFLPGASGSGSNAGDVWLNGSLVYNANPVLLGYGYQVLTHEIGHAIGLSHPSAYNAEEGVSITYAANASYFEDSRQYSIMSYFSETSTGGSFASSSGLRQYSAAPLLDDIAAVQRLYGANTQTRTGDTVYGFGSTADSPWFAATSAADVIFAVWDAGGADTLNFSGYSDAQMIDLRQGAFSNVGGLTGNVAIAVGAVIENATGGSGADLIFGNSGANLLNGGGGSDTLDGGLGMDTVVLPGARSSYTISVGVSFYTVTGPDGVTAVVRNVESLAFSDQTIGLAATQQTFISGDLLDNQISLAGQGTVYGVGGNDTLTGSAQTDYLNGGVGADVLSGGDGADILVGGAGNDVVDGGAGIDLFDIYVESSRVAGLGSTVDLGAGTTSGPIGNDRISNVENIAGSRYADTLIGDAGSNLINGMGGADTILGGDGADALWAGPPEVGGGAPDVFKSAAAANGSTTTAINLDSSFDAVPRADVEALPSATVVGMTHGGFEYFSFTATAGSRIVLDIDNAGFDSTLRLLGADGNQMAVNDDANPDNNERTDSLLIFVVPTTGIYYVEVGAWVSGSGADLVTGGPAAGLSYTLHISVPGHAVAPTTDIGSRMEGGGGDDQINGSAGRDLLYGGDGRDLIQAYEGNDNLQGNKGDDVLNAGSGDDFLFGGQDNDQMFGEVGNDWMNGNLGADVMGGGDGDDTMFGGQANDALTGGAGADRLVGDLGDDTLSGGDGADTLEGLAGADVLVGGAGADLLVGWAGADLLTGGAGADLFMLQADAGPLGESFDGDTITDFSGADLISVTGLTPTGLSAGGSAATYAQALQVAEGVFAALSVTAASVAVGADVYVFFDGADADRTADVSVKLLGVSLADITADDFV